MSFPTISERATIVAYTTERIRWSAGGRNDGRFGLLVYKPVGKGSRSGKADTWELVRFNTYAKRKTAKARATTIYYDHSPKAAKRHGFTRARVQERPTNGEAETPVAHSTDERVRDGEGVNCDVKP